MLILTNFSARASFDRLLRGCFCGIIAEINHCMPDLTTVLAWAVVIEAITILLRFGGKVSSQRLIKKVIKRFHLRFLPHIHHGMIGITLAVLGEIFGRGMLVNVGLGLLISDIIHHMVILWLLTGSPEFRLLYRE